MLVVDALDQPERRVVARRGLQLDVLRVVVSVSPVPPSSSPAPMMELRQRSGLKLLLLRLEGGVVDGLEHALVYNWNGDNAGPHASVEEYAAAWSVIARAFPNATGIYASTLDNFTQHLLAPAASTAGSEPSGSS